MSTREFDIIREDLHRRYDQVVPGADIDRVLDQAIATQTEEAKIQAFVPVLVERESAEKLEAMAVEAGAGQLSRKEILFVDQHNSGRSQLAAAIARHLSGDRVFVRSVGLTPQGGIKPVVFDVLAERGMRSDFLYQKAITPRVTHRADYVVLLGVDEIPGVPGDRYLKWDIPVSAEPDLEEARAIADQLTERITALLDEVGVLAHV